MTCIDLVKYIINNNLENEPVFKNGTFVGFVPAEAAAMMLGVGIATIEALGHMNKIEYVKIGNVPYVSINSLNDILAKEKM